MPIIKIHPEREFVSVSNQTARDRRLTIAASGLLIHILSYSEPFAPSTNELKKLFNIGRDRVQAISRELQFFGYLEIKPAAGDGGKFDGAEWTFFNSSRFPDRTLADFTGQLKNRRPDKPASGKPVVLFKKTGLKQERLNKRRKTETDTNAGTRENVAASDPSVRDLAFSVYASDVYGFPADKLDYMSAKQRNKIDAEIDALIAMDADLSSLVFFNTFWRANWRSIDRKSQTFQRVRVEQIRELYFEFSTSAELTAARMNLEKLQIEEKNTNGKSNKFDAVEQYDYSRFDEIRFDD